MNRCEMADQNDDLAKCFNNLNGETKASTTATHLIGRPRMSDKSVDRLRKSELLSLGLLNLFGWLEGRIEEKVLNKEMLSIVDLKLFQAKLQADGLEFCGERSQLKCRFEWQAGKQFWTR